jgi:hypothetical protein
MHSWYDLGVLHLEFRQWQDYRTLGEKVFWQKMNKTGGPTAKKMWSKIQNWNKTRKT